MDFQNPGLVWGLYAAGLLVFGLLYAFSLTKAGLKLLCAPLSVVFGTILAVVGARFFFLLPNLQLTFLCVSKFHVDHKVIALHRIERILTQRSALR